MYNISNKDVKNWQVAGEIMKINDETGCFVNVHLQQVWFI